MSTASSTLSGAASMAGTGASIGAMVGGPAAPITAAIGGVVGGLVGGTMGYFKGQDEEDTASKLKDNAAKLKAEQAKEYAKTLTNASRVKQSEYKENSYITNQYAFGSNNIAPVDAKALKISNNTQPVSSTGEKVVGESHEQGGVPTLDENGQPIELEGDEFIDGEGDAKRVFTNRLIGIDGLTFAKKAEQLSKEKGDLEQQSIDTNDQYLMDTLERQTEIIDMRLAMTYQEQEQAVQGMVENTTRTTANMV